MRMLIIALLLGCISHAGAAEPAVTQGPIHLDSPEELARLAAANPVHYAKATRLIAAANVLCQPGRPKIQNADAREISCTLLLLTSNPPKRQLSFTLDATHYMALVTLTADRPRPMPVEHPAGH